MRLPYELHEWLVAICESNCGSFHRSDDTQVIGSAAQGVVVYAVTTGLSAGSDSAIIGALVSLLPAHEGIALASTFRVSVHCV